MKKTLLFIVLTWMSVSLMAQDVFIGSTVMRNKMHYEENFDVMVENVKATADKDTTLDASTKAMMKTFAKSIVKNQLKIIELQKYILSLPEGEYTMFERWDGVNNRAMVFTPEIGRVIIWLGDLGRLIVAYPNLKTALDVTNAGYVTEQFRLSCTPVAPSAEEDVQEINGFRAVANFGLFPIETVGGDKSEAITIAGKDYVKVPAAGFKHELYGIIVQQNVTNDYYTQEQNLLSLKAESVAEGNFQLPEGYNVVNSADALVKSLKKAIKSNGLVISADVNNMPEVIWDVRK